MCVVFVLLFPFVSVSTSASVSGGVCVWACDCVVLVFACELSVSVCVRMCVRVVICWDTPVLVDSKGN